MSGTEHRLSGSSCQKGMGTEVGAFALTDKAKEYNVASKHSVPKKDKKTLGRTVSLVLIFVQCNASCFLFQKNCQNPVL